MALFSSCRLISQHHPATLRRPSSRSWLISPWWKSAAGESCFIAKLDIRSSTFYDNDLWWTTIRPNGTTKMPTISQSIFYNNGGTSHVFGDSVYFACNMIAGLLDWPSVRIGGFEAFPRFIDGTFRLEPGSPGNGCGYNTPSAPVDIDYEPRPSPIAFEVGADEL